MYFFISNSKLRNEWDRTYQNFGGKFISIDIKILLSAGLLIDPTTADAGDVLLRIEYSADIIHMNQQGSDVLLRAPKEI